MTVASDVPGPGRRQPHAASGNLVQSLYFQRRQVVTAPRRSIPLATDYERQPIGKQVERRDQTGTAFDPDMGNAPADVGAETESGAENRAIGPGRAQRVELRDRSPLALVAIEQGLGSPTEQ